LAVQLGVSGLDDHACRRHQVFLDAIAVNGLTNADHNMVTSLVE
jgi:hypothetical protein